MSTKELGKKGEDLAYEYLVSKGFKILERNCVLFCGEIDIIARKRWGIFVKNNKTVHFVEVKSLANNASDFFPEEKVDWKKQNKYKRLAEIWLSKNKILENTPYQIDIIAISFDEFGDEPEIKHFENVVQDRA